MSYGIIYLLSTKTCKAILLLQQSHGQTQHLVDVSGQATGIFTQAHISALSSWLEYKNNFSTFLLSGI